jgi:hypothetical protein
MTWWLENTAHGRRMQRRMLPESALLPNAKREAVEEREEEERRQNENRCLLQANHEGDHVYPTRKPIFDRLKDGEFSDPRRELAVPGVTVPANRPRCRARRRR